LIEKKATNMPFPDGDGRANAGNNCSGEKRFDDPIQLLDREIVDDDLPALPPRLDRDSCPESFLKPSLQIAVWRRTDDSARPFFPYE
jgi:hypothetical protein